MATMTFEPNEEYLRLAKALMSEFRGTPRGRVITWHSIEAIIEMPYNGSSGARTIVRKFRRMMHREQDKVLAAEPGVGLKVLTHGGVITHRMEYRSRRAGNQIRSGRGELSSTDSAIGSLSFQERRLRVHQMAFLGETQKKIRRDRRSTQLLKTEGDPGLHERRRRMNDLDQEQKE